MASRRYPIPSKPENLKEVFLSFCEDLKEDQRQLILQRLNDRHASLQSQQEEVFLGPNSVLGVQIAAVCIKLVESYSQFSGEQRELIAGATLYFLAERDFTPDDTPIVGYDDDARLLNHVLERIGQDDFFVSID
jgi:hypothetical protein